MAKRRRFATRQELTDLLVRDLPEMDASAVSAVLQALASRGVPVDALVKVAIDESLT